MAVTALERLRAAVDRHQITPRMIEHRLVKNGWDRSIAKPHVADFLAGRRCLLGVAVALIEVIVEQKGAAEVKAIEQ